MLHQQTMAVGKDILDNFDFEAVRALMLINKWVWCGEKESPSVARMRRSVYEMLETLAASPRIVNRVGTGGFKLTRFQWDDGSYELELLFAWCPMSRTFRA